ncbi:hypothetical protein A2U01_0001520, partial [Trifolium medium]|nr:hypothetical protein [Trifolium medium]
CVTTGSSPAFLRRGLANRVFVSFPSSGFLRVVYLFLSPSVLFLSEDDFTVGVGFPFPRVAGGGLWVGAVLVVFVAIRWLLVLRWGGGWR